MITNIAIVLTLILRFSNCQDLDPESWFPRLNENSQDFGLWPLFTPLLDVSPGCKAASIGFANSVLDESAEFISTVDDIYRRAGPGLRMIDSTGRLPIEGMLSDYQAFKVCEIPGLPAQISQICQIPAFKNLELKVPGGSTFSYGNSIECLEAGGRHCLAYYLQTEGTRQSGDVGKDLESLALDMENLLQSPGGRIISTYISDNHLIRSLMAENSEVLQALNMTSQLFADPPINNEIILAIVKYFINMWSQFNEGLGKPPGMGQCVPKSCSYEDIGINLNKYFSVQNFNSKDVGPIENSRYFCFDNETEVEWGSLDTFISVVFITIAILLGLGTLVDIVQRIFDSQKKGSPSFGMRMLLSFSIYTNFKEIISTRESGKDTITCLHGIRFLSMSWVVLGHSFLFNVGALNAANQAWLLKVYSGGLGLAFEAVAHAEPSVDTFFVLSGLLVAYLTFKELDRNNGQMNLVMYYVHRYLRLTIPMAFITAFYILCLPLIGRWMGSQQAYSVCLQEKEACTNWGWANLVYLNNFFDHGNDCIGVTWYTCDDMIFFWISLLVIYPMWSNGVAGGITWWLLWLFASTFPAVYESWTFHLVRDGARTGVSDEGFIHGYGKNPDFYRQPWVRFQPYLIGLLLGYILYYTKNKKIRMSNAVNAMGWQAAFLTGFAVVYGLYSEKTDGLLSNLEYTLFNGVARMGWGFAIAWVIFSCSRGYGGMIHDFLSWKFFLPLSRISFMTYLVHAVVIYLMAYYFSMDTSQFSLHLLVGLYLVNLIISMSLALVLTLAFESPFIKLEKLVIGALMQGAGGSQEKKKPV